MDILENNFPRFLCFASRQNAENFKSFIKIYMEETGATNGDNAYCFFCKPKIIFFKKISYFFTVSLDKNLINKMLKDILLSRGQNDIKNLDDFASFKKENGAISFNFTISKLSLFPKYDRKVRPCQKKEDSKEIRRRKNSQYSKTTIEYWIDK